MYSTGTEAQSKRIRNCVFRICLVVPIPFAHLLSPAARWEGCYVHLLSYPRAHPVAELPLLTPTPPP